LKYIVVLMAMVLWTAPPRLVADENRCHIVLVVIDDLGWQDTSVQFGPERSRFQDFFRTPNLQRLATHGVRFSQGYAHCVCSPSRVAIMTGQNPARHLVTNWILRTDRETSGTTDTLGPPKNWRKEGIQPGESTLATRLQAAGYRTLHVGKAHWGAIGTEGSDPCRLGFDVNIAGHAAGAPGSYQGADGYDKPDAKGKPSHWAVPGLEKYHGTETHLTDALASEAVAQLNAAIDEGGKPFFLYFAPYAVHTPLQPHRPFFDNYLNQNYPDTEIAIPETEASYASMVEGVDAAIGRIMQTLRDRNVADRTLIVFTSDNGGLSAHARGTTVYGTGANTHNVPLREGKGSAYEGGTRVPLIVAWATPDSGSPLQRSVPLKAGAICNTPVISEDLMPTLCRWAGIPVSEDERKTAKIDGRDFTACLAGKEPEPQLADRPLVFHYPHVWGPTNGHGYQPHSAIRVGDWKAIWFYRSQRWELYNLTNDIGEATDLAQTEPGKLNELAAELVGLLEERKATFPVEIQSGLSSSPPLPQDMKQPDKR
jgi:arylsulfatase A-like enzyme